LEAVDGSARTGVRRWAPLLTTAAVVLVAVVVALVALPGTRPAGPGQQAPSAGTADAPPSAVITTPEPLPADELPAPSGDPATDAALARCATAVVRSGRAAEYPPTAEWRSTLHMGTGAVESELTTDDAFGCLLTPAKVILSGTGGSPEKGVRVVEMAPGRLVVLNPQERRFTLGSGPKAWSDDAPVTFLPIWSLQVDGVPADATTDLAQVALSVEDGYEGLAGEPDQPLTVVDRDLPRRPDTPEGTELAECPARLPFGTYTDPDLWTPVARHDVGGGAPTALVARIGDIAAGFCLQDPVGATGFEGAPLPPPGGDPRPVLRYQGGASGLLLTAPPWVERMEVASQDGTQGPVACTVADGLAMCTLYDDTEFSGGGQPIVITAPTAADPRGTEVYRD
jgi:hypothetical protein